MVFTIEGRLGVRNEMLNAFRDLGVIEHIDTIFRQYDGNIYVCQMEFDELTPRSLTRIRRTLDAWQPYERPLLEEILETDCSEVQRMLDTPDPVKPSLSWCVQRYKEYHPGHWDEYWGALGSCGVTSADFLSFLRAKGCVSREQIDSGYARVVFKYLGDPQYATPAFPTEAHEVVQVGTIVIDWTRRQFDSDAPVPCVWINRTGEDQVFPLRKTAPATSA